MKKKIQQFKKKKKSENPNESTKPLLQLRPHGDGNKPLLPFLVARARLQETHPFQLIASHVAFLFHLSPPFLLLMFSSSSSSFSSLFVFLLFHNSTHTQKQKKQIKTPRAGL